MLKIVICRVLLSWTGGPSCLRAFCTPGGNQPHQAGQEPSSDQGEVLFHSPNPRIPKVELEPLHHPTQQLWAGSELGEQVRGNCPPGEFLCTSHPLEAQLRALLQLNLAAGGSAGLIPCTGGCWQGTGAVLVSHGSHWDPACP